MLNSICDNARRNHTFFEFVIWATLLVEGNITQERKFESHKKSQQVHRNPSFACSPNVLKQTSSSFTNSYRTQIQKFNGNCEILALDHQLKGPIWKERITPDPNFHDERAISTTSVRRPFSPGRRADAGCVGHHHNSLGVMFWGRSRRECRRGVISSNG